MKKKQQTNRSLEELIAALPNDPSKVKKEKKPSVRDAIINLQEQIGDKVFTKRQLITLIETKHPELAPVAMSNLEASISRATKHIECVEKGEQNIYRYKQSAE
ncbi:MAG: hypothetical protein KDN20_09315 [Verrucomicrobiae bacterium]|nr:hypothetical protein [Verrucomicrobiae bacterium]